MSYTINLVSLPCLECGRCGPEPDLPDPTYNLAPIFDLALTGAVRERQKPYGLALLDGKTGAGTRTMLALAVRRMGDPALADGFSELEPSNGWGTVEDARWVLEKLEAAARDYPDGVWEVT